MIDQKREIAASPFDPATEAAKTRIYSVMKHTPPRPPQQHVHKLPPMGAIAPSKTIFGAAPTENLPQQSAQSNQNKN